METGKSVLVEEVLVMFIGMSFVEDLGKVSGGQGCKGC